MVHLGETARRLREKQGLTQRKAAELLGISYVHLSNVENNKSYPSPDLLDKYRRTWGVDLYMLACCLFVDPETLPPPVREPMRLLKAAWVAEYGEVLSASPRTPPDAEHH